MSYSFEQGKDAIIQTVLKKIKAKLDKKQAECCGEVVHQLLRTVALDDLLGWNLDDLYAAMLNFWELMYQKSPGEQKIRIYNPDFERHGWQTTHTVIEIVHDDMPFLVDSVHMEINRMRLTSHLLIHMGGLKVVRNKAHKITDVLPFSENSDKKNTIAEAPIFIQVDRITNPDVLQDLHANLERVLEDNQRAVVDWQAMRGKVKDAIEKLDSYASFVDKSELKESKDFLAWLEDHHFTFLGVRDYKLIEKKGEMLLDAIPETGLGVLRDVAVNGGSRSVSAMTPEGRDLTLSPELLVISKTNTRSTVHRQAYTDYIGIKQFNEKGDVVGERRIVGLYTSIAYHTNPRNIPFLRRKVALVMKLSCFDPRSHAGKVLQNILDTLPRDDLFQASAEVLLEIAMGIFHMQERRRIRLFARKDIYGRFISCLVFVPKERFNTEIRQTMQDILSDSFNATESSFSTHFSDSVLARIHFILRIKPSTQPSDDFKAIEAKLVEAGRTWEDNLKNHLLDTFGEEECNRLFDSFGQAFPVGYRATFSSRTAVYDIKNIELLSKDAPMGLNFYRPVGEMTGSLRFKIYRFDETAPVSDVLPILENLGLRVISERPYVLRLQNGRQVWVNDFGMVYSRGESLNIDAIRERFQDAFLNIWYKKAENDSFNQLVLAAGLTWHEVSVLRAYAKYLKQIRFTFSQEYIENALTNNVTIARQLVDYFTTRFNPKKTSDRETQLEKLTNSLNELFDSVTNLDEDKILRRYVDLMHATLRTNYFQKNKQQKEKSYLSFKLKSSEIPEIPLPSPMYEIFVYSPRFEGVHLRCAKVARGGLRWSDRREDFRTEILGLMKAQQVKNAVIVPSGAKGGFVPKCLSPDGSREDIMAEGIACYKRFIRGLLDITDNYSDEEIIKPANVHCYDDDDPYLVVAADKGTATFSDIANEISEEYQFWLSDAFASGGSVGYDHKKMGITARGAWESVKRHFREKNINIQNEDFTVIGIGDMAGDVFGNGMLLSRHIRLVAAFNHMHIFIDPNPNAEASYEERQRLFNLPRSSWSDYDINLISNGGGIFNRSAKFICLSPEIKALLGIDKDKIEPNDLIKLLLQSSIDLLWNGGIGTFVKATHEPSELVGDRTNDAIRVSASELRCKVIGEGGNLGITQLARIEFALLGGSVYTDFIDNSAGVDCSDNEVNIKILLNTVVSNGDLTVKQRNQLLASMTDDVSKLVLTNNYKQTLAISLAARLALKNLELHARYIEYLEQEAKLDRSLEFIPDEKTLMERKLSGKGMATPGIAVLLCYTKILINEKILASDVPEDECLYRFLIEAFPKELRKTYKNEILNHKLKREILATKLSTIIVNEVGFTFAYRLQDETGAPISAIVRSYVIVRSIFDMEKHWKALDSLDNQIDSEFQLDILMQYSRLLRRLTRWFLRSERKQVDIQASIDLYGEGVQRLKEILPEALPEKYQEIVEQSKQSLMERGLPEALAHEVVLIRFLFSSLDIIDSSVELGRSIDDVTRIYFGLSEYLDLNWIRRSVIVHPSETHWEVLSREALRDDLDSQQRQLTCGIIRSQVDGKNLDNAMDDWSKNYHHLISRWQYMLAELRSAQTLNYTMYFVAIRELLDLTQTTVQASMPAVCKTILGDIN